LATLDETAGLAPAAGAPTNAEPGPGSLKLAVLVFLLVVAVSLPRHLVPLAFAGGSVDGDWFTLGANLASFGVLGFGEEPLVYRAPGFPLMVAAILKLTADPAHQPEAVVNSIGTAAVLLAQSFLLGVSALLFYLWLSLRLSAPSAFAAALLLGTNPYSLVVATLVHYDVLFWVLLLAFVLVLEVAFGRQGREALYAFFLAGLLLAAGALVRPVGLLVPLLLLPVFLARQHRRERLTSYSSLLLGFAVLLLPWTARNFAITGRLIPVHAQGWSAMFASTSEVMVRNPDVYQWNIVARHHYLPLYRRVTGETEITTETYARQVLKLEDAAREAALQNLMARPHIFAVNFVTAGTSLVTRINAILLTAFVKVQTHEPFHPRWIAGGVRGNLVRGAEARAFQSLHDALLIAGLFGLAAGLLRRDPYLAVPLAVFGAIVLTHALSYLDFYYYVVKVPFLVAFAFYAVDALPRPLRIAATVSLLGYSLGLTWAMGFLS